MAVGACGSDGHSVGPPDRDLIAEPSSAIDVVITDSAFVVSGPVRPGGTIRFSATSDEAHYVQVRKLDPGADLDDALEAADDQAALDHLAPEIGAPTHVLPPGRSIEITNPTMDVGEYLLLDFFPVEGDTDGRYHTDVGLVGHFTVAGDHAEPNAPTDRYSITIGTPISGPAVLQAGHHLLELRRNGDEFGFPTLFRLDDGRTLDEAIVNLNAIFANDVWPIGSGQAMAGYLIASTYPPTAGDLYGLGVELEPGRYALVALDYDANGYAAVGPERIDLTVTSSSSSSTS